MGCLKLNYCSDATLPKVMYGKSVLSEESAQIWLSVDPLSDKYPSLSPYVYCANNPVILVDPDGADIYIKGEDGVITTYVPGATNYDGEDEYTKEMITSLDKIHSSKSGEKVIDRLVSSDKKYTLDNEKGKTDNPETHSKGIHFNKYTDITTISHELFHSYQFDKGQGGGNIPNEVEAYMFDMIVTLELGLMSTFHSGLVENPIFDTQTNYNKSYTAFLRKDSMSENDFNRSFNTLVSGFKTHSLANVYGLYKNYSNIRPSGHKNLIKDFYPIIK